MNFTKIYLSKFSQTFRRHQHRFIFSYCSRLYHTRVHHFVFSTLFPYRSNYWIEFITVSCRREPGDNFCFDHKSELGTVTTNIFNYVTRTLTGELNIASRLFCTIALNEKRESIFGCIINYSSLTRSQLFYIAFPLSL